MASSADNTAGAKKGVAEIIINYLATTSPKYLFIHLIWMVIASCALSSSYIFAFHFTSLLAIYQEAHNIRNFNPNLRASSKQDAGINEALRKLLETVGGNRAYVFRYHNGLAAVNGVPFFFQTNTHEVISPGTSRVMPFEQHIPASMNLAINNQFVQNRCVVVPRTDVDRDSQHYWFFQNRAAKSLVRCPIFMGNGDLFGFVGIDFINEVDHQLLPSIEETTRSAASSIATIFATKH
jgi:hypothetical protein